MNIILWKFILIDTWQIALREMLASIVLYLEDTRERKSLLTWKLWRPNS